MTVLVLSTKWHEGFGIDGDELDDDNLLNYMKKKWFIFYNYEEEVSYDITDWEGMINDIEEITEQLPEGNDWRLMIVNKEYEFNNRTFGLKNNGIEIIQNKWREYYKKYILPKRYMRNIMYREIHGKFRY